MRWIYISPHFDDAVLSCGGLIWEQTHTGIPVEIWTVNSGDPPPGPDSELMKRMHAIWQTGSAEETVALRRLEDLSAAREVGATVRHLNMVDAIYRRTNIGSLLYSHDVFDPIHHQEIGIVEETTIRIAQGLNDQDTIVCPLALGGHVDHVIIRSALECLFRPLLYYEDVPYLFTHERELAAATERMDPNTYFISEHGLAAWQAGISAHKSQISSLFADLQDMRTKIANYRFIRNGLTLWERI
jgi:LmbE family N-acetylglucosaminyl deacetylase